MKRYIVILIVVLFPILVYPQFRISIQPAYNYWTNPDYIRIAAIHSMYKESYGGVGILVNGLFFINKHLHIGLQSGFLPVENYAYSQVASSYYREYFMYSIPLMGIFGYNSSISADEKFLFSCRFLFGTHYYNYKIDDYGDVTYYYCYYPAIGVGIGFEYLLSKFISLQVKSDLIIVYYYSIFRNNYFYNNVFLTPSIGICFKF